MKPAKFPNITSVVPFSFKLCLKPPPSSMEIGVTDPEPVSVTTKLKAYRKALDSSFNHEAKTKKRPRASSRVLDLERRPNVKPIQASSFLSDGEQIAIDLSESV